jgi:hypothetical protein
MRHINAVFPVSFFCSLLLTTVAAHAQIAVLEPPAVTISAGYSNLQTERSSNLFYDHSGPYFDADFAWRLPLVVPLQVGFGVTSSGYWERESVAIPAADNFGYPYYHLNSDVGLFELEPRVGLHLGRETGFFAVPRIGAGLLVDSYDIDQSTTSNGDIFLTRQDHTGAAFEIRPAIQAGYCWGPAAAGVEASYLYSWGDFGGLGHNAQEFRIGAFVTFSF